jgi:hypothetical protein
MNTSVPQYAEDASPGKESSKRVVRDAVDNDKARKDLEKT